MASNKNIVNTVLATGNFPNPFASPEEKATRDYGRKYKNAIELQWELRANSDSFYMNRTKEFEINRDYAAGRQSTDIYKTILDSLNNNDNDKTLLNLDWRPVPIVPKYVNIVVNKTLDRKPRPNLEAVDPVSLTDKDKKRARLKALAKNKELVQMAEQAGLKTDIPSNEIPDTTEEAEIFAETSLKTNAEIAAELAASITLEWNDFDEILLRRFVRDLVEIGMAVPMRYNDPTYGIVEKYIDPSIFIHSYTEDQFFRDITYAGHVEKITISELKRIVTDNVNEDEWKKIANTYKGRYSNKVDKFGWANQNSVEPVARYPYDEYLIDVIFFQFKTVETQYFEEKENKYGNKGFYKKGAEYKAPKKSIFERKPYKMDYEVTYSGIGVIGHDNVFNYCKDQNMPRNMHDISRTNMRYFPVAIELRNMLPSGIPSKIRGFADQLQLTHLKWQQALAKVKADGFAINQSKLENVTYGGKIINPLDIMDIFEKTNVLLYRDEEIDGARGGSPIIPLPQRAEVFMHLANTYNHYIRMIQDATGVNDALDASSPKGEQLVGVREQAIQAGNNATYDIVIAMKHLYGKVVQDIVKCLQVLPRDSALYAVYEKAIGTVNMKVLNDFKDLPMSNFGVTVSLDMDEMQRAYLEQNIQISLSKGELDIEDALAIRELRNIDQAERLLVIRRKRRIERQQQMQLQNIQAQAEANAQAAQATSQAEAQLEQVRTQLAIAKMQEEHKLKLEEIDREYAYKVQIEMIGAGVKEKIKEQETQKQDEREKMREDRKDKRQQDQAVNASHMVEQRKGTKPPLENTQTGIMDSIIGQ